MYGDGTLYEGGWAMGREHGKGQLMTGDRQIIYTGEWVDGTMTGHGTYVFNNGDRYTGDWREGTRHGKGEYQLSNGCSYIGDWKNNKRTGSGVFNWADGSTYDGDWENDNRHGRGLLALANGFRYDGCWFQNYMEGRGVSVFPGGQEYQTRVSVPAAKGYGERDPAQVQRVKRAVLPVEGELKVGETFQTGEDRYAPVVTVVGIEGDEVLLDGNHPLAGVDLTFDVEIVGAREANAEELRHGHAHGADGGHCH